MVVENPKQSVAQVAGQLQILVFSALYGPSALGLFVTNWIGFGVVFSISLLNPFEGTLKLKVLPHKTLLNIGFSRNLACALSFPTWILHRFSFSKAIAKTKGDKTRSKTTVEDLKIGLHDLIFTNPRGKCITDA